MIPATELRRYSFLWIPKVTFRPFSTFVLHGLGPNPAAVRMFRRSSSKAMHVLKEGRFSGFGITSDISDSSYRAQALCFSMDSKGNVGPFFRRLFCMAWDRILLQFECFGSALPRPYYEDRLLIFGITKLESYK